MQQAGIRKTGRSCLRRRRDGRTPRTAPGPHRGVAPAGESCAVLRRGRCPRARADPGTPPTRRIREPARPGPTGRGRAPSRASSAARSSLPGHAKGSTGRHDREWITRWAHRAHRCSVRGRCRWRAVDRSGCRPRDGSRVRGHPIPSGRCQPPVAITDRANARRDRLALWAGCATSGGATRRELLHHVAPCASFYPSGANCPREADPWEPAGGPGGNGVKAAPPLKKKRTD